MTKRVIFCLLIVLTESATAVIGGGDNIDFTPLPNEFCNDAARQKHKNLLSQYPEDEGIINLNAYFIGLCQLVTDGNISEHEASIFWAEQRDKLLQERRTLKK